MGSQVCDVCSASTSFAICTTYTASEFKQIVRDGFGPDEKNITMLTMMGLSRSEAIERWKTGLVATSTTDWVLCPSCAGRASRYMSKPAGTGPTSGSGTESLDPIIKGILGSAPGGAGHAPAVEEPVSKRTIVLSLGVLVGLVVLGFLGYRLYMGQTRGSISGTVTCDGPVGENDRLFLVAPRFMGGNDEYDRYSISIKPSPEFPYEFTLKNLMPGEYNLAATLDRGDDSAPELGSFGEEDDHGYYKTPGYTSTTFTVSAGDELEGFDIHLE